MKSAARRPVGDDDHLAGPGDRVDVDLAEDLLLGQRDEQVAGADDLVDARRDARRRRRPAPPPPAPRPRGRPRSRPARGTWPAGRWLYEPNGVGGATTAICSTPAACAGTTVISTVDGYAAAPPGTHTPTRAQRQVALREVAAVLGLHRDVAVQDRLLESRECARESAARCRGTPDPPPRGPRPARRPARAARRPRAACRRAWPCIRAPPSRPRCAHVAADPLDDLHGRQRLAEDLDRLLAGPPRSPRSPSGASLARSAAICSRDCGIGGVDAGDVEGHGIRLETGGWRLECGRGMDRITG